MSSQLVKIWGKGRARPVPPRANPKILLIMKREGVLFLIKELNFIAGGGGVGVGVGEIRLSLASLIQQGTPLGPSLTQGPIQPRASAKQMTNHTSWRWRAKNREGARAQWSTGALGGVDPQVPINFWGEAITPGLCALFLSRSQATEVNSPVKAMLCSSFAFMQYQALWKRACWELKSQWIGPNTSFHSCLAPFPSYLYTRKE